MRVTHLTTGEEAGVRADQDFSSASVINLTFMVRAYQMADRMLESIERGTAASKASCEAMLQALRRQQLIAGHF